VWANPMKNGLATVTVVAADLISRARAGDGVAFQELTEPHLRERMSPLAWWVFGRSTVG